MAAGERWTRQELLVLLNIYDKLKFSQFDQRNPVVIDVAAALRRTPSAVAMKLGNLASFDPVLQARGIKGLPGASALDGEVWTEFRSEPGVVVPESEAALAEAFDVSAEDDVEVLPRVGVRPRRPPPIETEIEVNVLRRLGQSYFRDAVLNNFDGRCVITGLSVRSLLVASHIRPWSDFPAERLEVRNGLALNRLHDAAFDRFLIGFDANACVVIAPALRKRSDDAQVAKQFLSYEGQPMQIQDDSVMPNPEFIIWHHSRVIGNKGLL